MLAVLSPAKKLNFDPVSDEISASLPEFQSDANHLASLARKLSVSELRVLMKISEDLANLTRDRFKSFARSSDKRNSKQAMLAFAGDTYTGLRAETFTAEDRDFAQTHLRILSGLYGVLKPLDRIQPHRLEMGCRLANEAGPSLYAYWGEKLAQNLDAAAKGRPVINLASAEYFRVANQKKMRSAVITPSFKELRNGELKMIGFFAKKARGAMARYMMQNRINTVDGLKAFDLDGYGFRPEFSDEISLVFSRNAA
ncbi:MAG: peroxide stress protein YaaA [Rhodobacteraceae bacterium]|nr:peroxide stress protein YaaA [Paracoccaceae bacterium]